MHHEPRRGEEGAGGGRRETEPRSTPFAEQQAAIGAYSAELDAASEKVTTLLAEEQDLASRITMERDIAEREAGVAAQQGNMRRSKRGSRSARERAGNGGRTQGAGRPSEEPRNSRCRGSITAWSRTARTSSVSTKENNRAFERKQQKLAEKQTSLAEIAATGARAEAFDARAGATRGTAIRPGVGA